MDRATLIAPKPAHPPTPRGRVVALNDVRVRYGNDDASFLALDGITASVDDGDFVALVGPSGCGKSTILKLVAGLLRPSEGAVIVAGREVGAVRVGVGMAFQNPTMLPWLTIRQNIMLPLKIVEPYRSAYHRERKRAFRDRAEALLQKVGLAGFGDRHPWQLSGGMLQRASLCRALIHEPRLLMLDEPFGALDQFTREELWSVLQALWMESRPTVFLVTHDLREAAFLATRILVMSPRPGRVTEDRTVDFTRPRTLDTTYEEGFVALTHALRSSIVSAQQSERAQA